MKGKSPGFASDVWSFGMLMFFIFVKKTPFDDLQKNHERIKKEELYK